MAATLTCINCPLGCLLEATVDADGAVVSVRGNQCPRGVAYAGVELTRPTRMVATTVRLHGGPVRMAPVKTASPVPRDQVRAVAAALAGVCLDAPVRIGDVVARDVAGTGVDVVATRSLPRIA